MKQFFCQIKLWIAQSYSSAVSRLASNLAKAVRLNWLRSILPNRCLLCHQHIPLPDSGICSVCLQQEVYQTPVCLGCGKTMVHEYCYCGACASKTPLKVVAPCSYHSNLGRLVGLIKYQHQFAVISPMTEILRYRINYLLMCEMISMPQALIPVPLHRCRLQKRGYNQAYLIAKSLGAALNIPVVTHYIERVVDTPSQAGLSGKQRRVNLKSAFRSVEHLPFQNIAIIDDVVTTGTTVAEISHLLEKQHIEVQVWCLARAEKPSK